MAAMTKNKGTVVETIETKPEDLLNEIVANTEMAKGKTPEAIKVPKGWVLLPAGVERFIRVDRDQLHKGFTDFNKEDEHGNHPWVQKGKYALVFENRKLKVSGFEIKVLGTCTLANSNEVAYGCGGGWETAAAGMITKAALLVQVEKA